MAFIWSGSKAPNYLTACRELCYINSDIAKSLTHGVPIVIEKLIYVIKDRKKVSKGKFVNWETLSTTTGVPLVNQRVLDILERECSGKFQAIPAIIKLPDNQEIRDYFVVNVIHKVPLFSLENSIKHPSDANNNDLKKIKLYLMETKAFKAAHVDTEDLCRDNIINSSLIFISDRLRNIFKKEKVKGAAFYKSLRNSVVFV